MHFLKCHSSYLTLLFTIQGELAIVFGELLRKLWSSGRTSVAPRAFKAKLSRFAPQFSGYNQHDSQVGTMIIILIHLIFMFISSEDFFVICIFSCDLWYQLSNALLKY